MPQLHTMALLSQGAQRMGVIAWRLNSSQSAATSMIDRLVDKGLVERVPDKDDRRVVACQLTEPGREEMERLWRVNRMRISLIADHLTIEELSRVVEANNNAFILELVDYMAADTTLFEEGRVAQRSLMVANVQQTRLQDWLQGLRYAARIIDRRDEVLNVDPADQPLVPPIF